MSTRAAWCGLVALCLSALATRADAQSGWSETFPDPVLSPWVQPGVTRVLVVAVGAERAEAELAAQVVRERLRALSAALVMDGEALGALEGLDDAAIVSRAAAQPTDEVVILRAFPAAPGAQPNIAVVVYARDGQVRASMSGTRGKPLTRPSAPTSTTETAAGAPAPSAREQGEPSPAAPTPDAQRLAEAQRQYDEQHIGFDEAISATQDGEAVTAWPVTYRGKYKEPLRGEAFYLALERPDLAADYRKRMSARTALGVFGGLAMLVGSVLLAYGVRGHEVCRGDPNCPTGPNPGLAAGGALVAVVGGVLLLTGVTTRPQPVTAPEARRLVEEHNLRLRQRLGLARPSATPSAPTAPTARLSWGAFAAPRAAGLSLQLQM